MDSTIIEGNAVDYVKLALRRTGIINPDIKDNDKTQCWDGELFVYDSAKLNKENLLSKIPVQIKGRTFDRYRKSFPIDKTDLINFKKNKNILYFLVEFVGEQHKIFYTALQLYDLEKILKNKNTRKSVTLPFEEFPENDPEHIKKIILSFIRDAQKQSQLIPGVLNVQELKKKTKVTNLSMNITLPVNFSGADIYNSISRDKPYVYFKDDKGIEFVVDRIESAENFVVGRHQDEAVCVNGIQYYSGYDIVDDKNGTHIQFGKTIDMQLIDNKLRGNYKLSGTIDERIKAIECMLAIYKGGIVSIGSLKLPLKGISQKRKIEQLKNYLAFYKDVKAVTAKLGISKEIDVSKLTQQQAYNLYEFCQSELHDKDVSLGKEYEGVGFLRLNNVNILCFCHKSSTGNKVFSVFREDLIRFNLDVNGEDIPVSSYLIMVDKGYSFSEIDNINYNDMITSITKHGIQEKTLDQHTELLLKMLLYYDSVKNPQTLDASIALAKLLHEYSDTQVNYINLCQSLKRKRGLLSKEIKKLMKIKEKSSDIDIKLACSILLEGKLECRQYWEQMEPQQKEKFSKYPIMNLYDTN